MDHESVQVQGVDIALGKGVDGIEAAAKNATHDATDQWASAEYRQDIAVTLAKRCLEE